MRRSTPALAVAATTVTSVTSVVDHGGLTASAGRRARRAT